MTTGTGAPMAAGRELDAMIAERVMGFWRDRGRWWGPHPSMPGERAYASVCVPGHLWGPSVNQADGLPKFSTDVAAAMLALDALCARGYGYQLTRCIGESGAACTLFDATPAEYSAHADTLALAICRALLAAMEGAC